MAAFGSAYTSSRVRTLADDKRRSARLMLGCLLVACMQAVTLPAEAQSTARKPLSAAERAQLAAGKLVVRPTTERRMALKLIGGSSYQVVDAVPDAVFRALLDTRYYEKMLPAVTGAELVSEQADARRVRIDHKKGPLGVSYRMLLRIDRARRDIGFKLNDPLDSGIRAAWGFLTVHPYGATKSLISYGVMADPGDGLLVGLARGVIHDWLLRVPEQVRKFVESATGRSLYGARSAGAARQLHGAQPQQRAP
jgi:hypothetical protein